MQTHATPIAHATRVPPRPTAFVGALRDDPSAWWAWSETARRVLRLHAHGDAFGRGTMTGRQAAVEDLADRLRWSFAGRDGARAAEWCETAEELLRAVGGARWVLGRAAARTLGRLRARVAALR